MAKRYRIEIDIRFCVILTAKFEAIENNFMGIQFVMLLDFKWMDGVKSILIKASRKCS
jgi:hypothetical protein